MNQWEDFKGFVRYVGPAVVLASVACFALTAGLVAVLPPAPVTLTPTAFPPTLAPSATPTPYRVTLLPEQLPFTLYQPQHHWILVVTKVADDGCKVGDDHHYTGIWYRTSAEKQNWVQDICRLGGGNHPVRVVEGVWVQWQGDDSAVLLYDPSWVTEPFE